MTLTGSSSRPIESSQSRDVKLKMQERDLNLVGKYIYFYCNKGWSKYDIEPSCLCVCVIFVAFLGSKSTMNESKDRK